MGNELFAQVGIELVKMLLSGAVNMAKTLKIPADQVDAEFEKVKAEFDKLDTDWRA
jgi:hypothetical protein